ncbi:MAG: hypothetical protein HFH10_10220 [Dorea sp.]|nr:hypothetical protein [Dorea sp.]
MMKWHTYLVQGILFLIFCAAMRQIRPLYFGAFLLGVIYGIFINAFGAGTLIMACCNGSLIGVYNRWFDRHFEVGNGRGVLL